MMNPEIKAKLLEINQIFYQHHSGSFSATRHQVQPGVRRLIDSLQSDARIIDIGCGNGTLARHLAERGFSGEYLGVDLSADLLDDARRLLCSPPSGTYIFQKIDLAEPNWSASIPTNNFDWLVAFAVLHHLPGADLRLETVRAFRNLISPHGRVALSVWQWQNSSRLRKRVIPWSTVGLKPDELDAGDVLLDWRAGDSPGMRYVHTFSEDRLSELAFKSGFEICDMFYSDGKMGNLALYQVWRTAQK